MSDLRDLQIDGQWVNQNGSILEVIEHKGTLEGSYISRKGRSASGKNYPLIGQRNGSVLAFLVNWEDEKSNLESITSFSGRLIMDPSGVPTIHTMWVLVRQWEDQDQKKPAGDWNSFLTNADTFIPMD